MSPPTSPNSHTSSTASLAPQSQQFSTSATTPYGLNTGRCPSSHSLFEGVWNTAIQTCLGTMTFEELKMAVAAAQLAGLDWAKVDLGEGKADEVVVDMVRAARGAVDGRE